VTRLPSIYLVAMTMVGQLACLWFSLQFGTFSIFCAGASAFVPSASHILAMIFSVLHMLLAGLLFLGLASLRFVRVRMTYVIFAVFCMCLLPVQSALVKSRHLSCDGF